MSDYHDDAALDTRGVRWFEDLFRYFGSIPARLHGQLSASCSIIRTTLAANR